MQNRQNRNGAARTDPCQTVVPAGGIHRMVQTSDPAEYELALQPFELLCLPTAAGRFSHRIHAFATADILFYREAYDLGVRLRGLTPAGMLMIGIPVVKVKTMRLWGKTQPDWNVPISLPTYLRANFGAGYEHLIAGLRVDRLRNTMSPEAFARLEGHARAHVITCNAASRKRLHDWIVSGLARPLTQPDLVYSSEYAAAMFDDLLGMLVGISEQAGDASVPRKTSRTQRGFERAVEFIRTAEIADVRLARLCEVSGISERSLRYAFRDQLDMSPIEFIMRRRLHAARQALFEADPSSTLISNVATEYGFYELGRFAGRYFSQFGELPSETLKRAG